MLNCSDETLGGGGCSVTFASADSFSLAMLDCSDETLSGGGGSTMRATPDS